MENREKSFGGYSSTNQHLFENLPFKAFWVFLSGKEMKGRKRLFVPNNFMTMLIPILWTIIGCAGIYWSLSRSYLSEFVLVVSLILIVGGARYMVGTNIHMMAHNLLFKSKLQNKYWGEVLTTIFFIQSYKRYREDHLLHHGKVFGSLDDGDAKSIVQLGFTPDKTTLQLWINLFKLSVSPAFHYKFLKGRVIENLLLCSNPRKLLTVVWISTLMLIGYFIGYEYIFYGYVLPIIFICQIAALLQLICEHIWIYSNLSSKECHYQLCNGRYCGVALPKSNNKSQYCVDLVFWFLRIFFIELPARIMILQGTLPSHDWHHRFGSNKKWADSAMLKELDIESQLSMDGKSNYYEVWGFIEILDNVFVNISESAPYPEVINGDIELDYGDIK